MAALVNAALAAKTGGSKIVMALQSPINHAHEIRAIVARHARLTVDIDDLSDESDLYHAGLTSLTTVNLMLALESHFNADFPDHLLSRKTFSSIRSLSEAIEEALGWSNQDKTA